MRVEYQRTHTKTLSVWLIREAYRLSPAHMKLVRNISSKTYLITLILYLALFLYPVGIAESAMNDIGMGLPVGGISEEPDYELYPKGTRVVSSFLRAWKNGDYTGMYDLLDDSSKEGYSRKQAIFDFRLLVYKPYTISSIKKRGDDFEFIISCGSWEDGDKELRKMIINGKTGKVIMPSRNSPFKRSAEDYF